ncbi:hypothetical protein HHK36_017975 [Tetracentron sinense]|uniref:Bacterial surface antigen (D15) domain-containing protein n=1 Tax=Tetracentron sinense TaxID=13715 RepID=A0A835DAE5_TETSI|nr:hypothetical protein HHK36_017975 [Tetracentron sinense]
MAIETVVSQSVDTEIADTPSEFQKPNKGHRAAMGDRPGFNGCRSYGMGAQKSIHAGKAKIDVNVDFTHKLCTALMLPPFRNSGNPLSQVIGSICIKHPNLFGGSEKLDASLDKGLYDSNILITYRKPRPEWLAQQSFVIQHSILPEIGVHGFPIENFSRSGSGGVNLSRFSAGVDLNEPASSNWSSTTSIKFEHVRPINDDGRSISRDLDGFPVTCSGSYHDSMVVLKQESRFAKENDHSFSQLSLQIEQGIPVLFKWLVFNRFKFVASKGVKLGPAFLLSSLTGGSIVGDMAPYQAFAIGGLGNVRGYGEGAVGSGRSCLVANSEMTFPLLEDEGSSIPINSELVYCAYERILLVSSLSILKLLGKIGSNILAAFQHGAGLSRRYSQGNPALRLGKPGSGIGIGYGIRLKSQFGHFQIDYAINAFQQKTVYFGISNIVP